VLGRHRNLSLVRRSFVAPNTGPALMTDFVSQLKEIFDATMFDRLEAYEVLPDQSATDFRQPARRNLLRC
jgi:hypothetical protein